MQFIDLKKQYASLKEDIDKEIAEVLNNCDFILGKKVGEIEDGLAAFVGDRHCISCANGTDALTLALAAMKIGEDDVVFVPNFTFFATAEAVVLNKSRVVFVDVDEDTFNISPQKLEEAILKVLKEGKYNPKAVIAVDLFGLPANYPEIKKIINLYDLLLIEDGAQGFGGSLNKKMACSFGDISTTSFFPAKPLGCYGDGGALFTDNEKYATKLKSLRFHGKGNDKYDNIRIGYNSRLDTIQAAVLKVKLKAFADYELDRRVENGKLYDSLLEGVVKTPVILDGYVSSYAQYTITLKTKIQRDDLMAFLKENNVPSMVYYPKCMDEQTVFANYDFNVEDLATSKSLSKRVLSLPMHPYLEEEEIKNVAQLIKKFMCKNG